VPRGRKDEPVLVTSAHLSHSDDITIRERRYAITQLCRIVCVALAVLLPVPIPVKLLFVAGAVVLPWMGVVAANAGPTVASKRRPSALIDSPTVEAAPLRIAIEPGRVIDQD
jgi:Protein of unknown function (DUF3099)